MHRDGADGALSEGGGNHQAPSWSFGVCHSQHTHSEAQGGGISRLAGGAVRQLLVFQKKLAPGSNVNNELILSARAQHTTSVLEQAVLFKAHTEVIHSPL